jgi:hypothetical protein
MQASDATLQEIAASMEREVASAREPFILRLGAPFLMATGFLCVNVAVRVWPNQNAAFLFFMCALVIFYFWRMTLAYSEAKTEIRQMHLVLTALSAVLGERRCSASQTVDAAPTPE